MKVKISDLYDVGSSKRVFQSEWRDDGIPFYRAREIAKLSTDGFVDNELFIDEELYESYIVKYGKPQAGDIMITGVGTLGVCYIVRESDKFYFKDGNILWFKQKAPDRILPQYLVKAFDSKDIKEFIKKNSSGTTVGTFTIQTANKMEIELPSIEEQRAFVTKISLVEEVIRKRKTELQKLDDLIKARFVEMFGNPLDGTAKYPIHQVGEVADLVDPQPSHRTPPIEEGGIPYVSIKDCDYKTGKIDFEGARKVSRKVLEEHLNRYTLREGDFVIGKIGTIGNPVFVPTRYDYTLSANVVLIQPNSELVSPYFLKYSFESDFVERQFAEAKNSTSQAAFGIQKVRIVEVMNPDIEVQRNFENFVNQVDKSKVAVQKALDETQLLFDSLMQEYFG